MPKPTARKSWTTPTGNASRFNQVVAEYQKAPAVTRDRMYLDTMQQIFSSTSKVMVDAKSGNNLLYLPLDKLMAQTAANEAAIGSHSGRCTAPAAGAQPAQPAGRRRRSSSRSKRSRSSRRPSRSRPSRPAAEQHALAPVRKRDPRSREPRVNGRAADEPPDLDPDRRRHRR